MTMTRNPDPLLLSFDTSAAHCAACLVRGETILADISEPMARGQAERIMGLLTEVLNEADTSFHDVDALAVGIGPGNFTGIRISVSAARGMALALKIPAIGVSLLEAAAFGHDGSVLSCLSAPRDSAYLQLFGQGASEPLHVALAACNRRGQVEHQNVDCLTVQKAGRLHTVDG